MENKEEIVNSINDIVDTEFIYIFGSYAKGQEREDSDLDIYIVAKKFNDRKINVVRKIRRKLINVVNKPMDILVNTKDDFDNRVKAKATLEYIVSKEGVKIYG